jgi:hypothetical protein
LTPCPAHEHQSVFGRAIPCRRSQRCYRTGTIQTTTELTDASTGKGVSTNSNPSGDGGSGLYVTSGSDLYSINRTTGTATLIGVGSYVDIFGLAFTNNTMYAIDSPSEGTQIYALSLTNGQTTTVTTYDSSVVGGIEAVAVFNSASVPEPSSLVLSGMAAVGVMIFAVRRGGRVDARSDSARRKRRLESPGAAVVRNR